MSVDSLIETLRPRTHIEIIAENARGDFRRRVYACSMQDPELIVSLMMTAFYEGMRHGCDMTEKIFVEPAK